mmetsp:Transcript_4095/g.8711  ORF Transcript_4095/g.8711 Transcript_4095/m.8711 type:complete len:388 (-) Transcript_4095:50-1213(-)
MHQTLSRLSRKMLILSEAEVRQCLPIDLAIRANRVALGSLRRTGDGGATVPTRIGLPYRGGDNEDGSSSSTSAASEDWTLFKPAAYSPPGVRSGVNDNRKENDDEEAGDLMGMKLVSVRGGNPALGLPTVPATVMLVDCPTGQVSALLGGTYLTAARTAAGSAIATDAMTLPSEDPLHLTVFGAGLQAEMHIDAVRSVRHIGHITLVNRSTGRAEELIEKVRQQTRKEEEQEDIQFSLVLLADRDGVKQAVSRADIICTTTNTVAPLFDGSWVKPGCHLNGVGSYTRNMEEIDSAFIESRCRVVVDTPEAVDVGDLKLVSDTSENYVGLLGDVLAGNATLDATATSDSVKYDCTMFKSVGTAIQDVITAHEVYKRAIKRGIGLQVEM